ncbi:MAG TPA: dihydroorotate dehydrogenase [Paludibacteraceae bacterium]|nr:dihydroorotate dehydrogenase [Paludibacteraceae bacterium]HOL00913.1 dihydroorotate dehydrogenase [Paludibacteraceae bacterium]
MVKLNVDIGKLQLKNPVMTASGTFGYGIEYADFLDLSRIGSIIVKSITLRNREGNPYPRMKETASGMLNAVGLQNKGVKYFVENIYPLLKNIDTCIIANIAGSTIEEYVQIAEILNELDKISALELNISCPNVKEGGMLFGNSSIVANQVVTAVRRAYSKELIVKLSPNVTSISEIAIAVESAGADAISLINTLVGMAIDIETRKPCLSTITGGLSGPAIKPVAVRMVWEAAHAVKIPIIGIGGIMNAADAIEFLLAGATAIEVGTANFMDPTVTIKIIEGIEQYLIQHGFDNVYEIIGAMENK